MALAPIGLTFTMPNGSISEVTAFSIDESQGTRVGYTHGYTRDVGSISLTSYVRPSGTIGVRGSFGVSSGTGGFSYAMDSSYRCYIASVSQSCSVNGVVTYNTTLEMVRVQ